ncbi:MAG: putative porin [Deltaproteobacteria bacterium]|nr:putative porin [Deltaproteobacteria bacterium]MBI3386717.1 putative porin [Deltaproteobacteria bacterium]
MMPRAIVALVRAVTIGAVMVDAVMLPARMSQAKDLGDILLKKGLITEEELKQAREEDKQKSAAEESRRDAIVAKLPKWLDMITPFGDMRTRYEGFYENELHARNRFRLRARIGLSVNPSDEAGATFRLASGNSNDPISTNQDFTKTFTPNSINLDWAYMTVKPGKTVGIDPGLFSIIAGKFGVSSAVYRVSEIVWDDDLSPEGAAESLNLVDQREGFLRGLKLNTMQWVVDEVATAGDPWMFGGQVVADTAFNDTTKWTLSLADYSYQDLNEVATKYLSAFTGKAPYTTNSNQNTSLANSNSVTLSPKDINGNQKVTGFLSGFNLINFNSELNFVDPFRLGLPAGVFGDVVYNTEADSKNTGFTIGAGIGKAGKDWYHDGLKNPGDWGVSYDYAWIEKDAVLSLFNYSDFDYIRNYNAGATQKGGSNVVAHILRGDYLLFPNFQLTAKVHFINALDRDDATTTVGQPLSRSGNSTLVRTQLDATLKF